METEEVADEMIGDVVAPYIEDLARYQTLKMPQEALSVCQGIIQGLYQFETESTSEFKDWAIDLPQIYADEALKQWYTKEITPEAVKEMQSFIGGNLPQWGKNLKRSLTPPNDT